MSYVFKIPEGLEFTFGALRATYRSYADFIYNGPVILKYETSSFGTAHATETSITIDPAFDRTLSTDERIGVLMHELFHVILADVTTMKRWHAAGMVQCPTVNKIPARMLPYDSKIANIGMDCRINDAITRILGGKLPSGACYHPDITFNCTSEELYTIIWDEENGGGPNQNGLSGNNGYQPGDGKSPSKGGQDVSHEGDPEPGPGQEPSPYHSDPTRMREMARQAVMGSDTSKSKGIGPGDLARLANMVHPKKIPWREIIDRTVRAGCGCEQSDWARPHKTYMGLGRYWPGKRDDRAGVLVAQCDSSGSMTQMELGLVIGVLADVVPDVLPERLIMLDVDDKVQRVREFEDPEDFIEALRALPCREDREASIMGGGGTNMAHGFTWCKENGIEPDVMITLTDAGTAWPDSHEPAMQSIIAVTDPRPEIIASIPAHMGTVLAITPDQ